MPIEDSVATEATRDVIIVIVLGVVIYFGGSYLLEQLKKAFSWMGDEVAKIPAALAGDIHSDDLQLEHGVNINGTIIPAGTSVGQMKAAGMTNQDINIAVGNDQMSDDASMQIPTF